MRSTWSTSTTTPLVSRRRRRRRDGARRILVEAHRRQSHLSTSGACVDDVEGVQRPTPQGRRHAEVERRDAARAELRDVSHVGAVLDNTVQQDAVAVAGPCRPKSTPQKPRPRRAEHRRATAHDAVAERLLEVNGHLLRCTAEPLPSTPNARRPPARWPRGSCGQVAPAAAAPRLFLGATTTLARLRHDFGHAGGAASRRTHRPPAARRRRSSPQAAPDGASVDASAPSSPRSRLLLHRALTSRPPSTRAAAIR